MLVLSDRVLWAAIEYEEQAVAGKATEQSPECKPTPRAPGVISNHELYAIDEVKRRMRWTDSALRSARTMGLRLLTCGKRKYVTGREIIRFLESLSKDS